MPLKLITAPVTEPITLDEAKLFLRLNDIHDDDDVVTLLIKSARRQAEKITGYQLLTATWELYLDGFLKHRQRLVEYAGRGSQYAMLDGPMQFEWYLEHLLFGNGNLIRVPLPPLQSVTSIKYLDGAGVQRTLDPSLYIVDAVSIPARITPAYNKSWPDTYPVINAVTIALKAGFGDTAASIPDDILNWIRAMVSALYENRELVVVNNSTVTMVSLPFLDGLLDDYRYWSF